MNYEIEFRGKSKRGNRWIYGYYYYNPFTTDHWIKTVAENGTTLLEDVEILPESVCQYINRIDKNGKKIYHKDIIKWNNIHRSGAREGICRVVWNGDSFYIEDSNFGWEGELLIGWCDDIEVLGNEIDNPNLIEKKDG